MPRQDRKPCSGCGFVRMIASHSATVDGPIFSAAASRRAGVQKAYRRCALGMCSGIVVCRRFTPRACVAGDARAAMEHLDGGLGGPHLDDLADQPGRHRVEVPLNFDVVIRRHAGAPPFGILIGLGWQRHQGGPIDGVEELTAAGTELAHQAGIEFVDQRCGSRRSTRRARRSAGCAAAPESIARRSEPPPRPWPCRAACAAASA